MTPCILNKIPFSKDTSKAFLDAAKQLGQHLLCCWSHGNTLQPKVSQGHRWGGDSAKSEEETQLQEDELGVSWNDGFPQQPWVFLLKMIILGCEMGVPPFKETPSWWFFTNPSEKYARQVGSFPQVGANIKKYLKPPPRKGWYTKNKWLHQTWPGHWYARLLECLFGLYYWFLLTHMQNERGSRADPEIILLNTIHVRSSALNDHR